jgi:hypothetical protein
VSKKTVCEIPSHWKLSDWLMHSCTDNSHRHITSAKASEDTTDGASEWIAPPRDRRGKKIVRVIARNIPIRGTSALIGTYLKIALAAEEDWAVTMFATIRMRREVSSVVQINA